MSGNDSNDSGISVWNLEGDKAKFASEDFLSSLNQAVESAVVFVLCATVVMGNLLTIISMLRIPRRREPMDFYVLSLSTANLIVGVGAIPLSLAAISQALPSGVHNYELCCVGGYLQVTLCVVNMYTFMWMSVDRYIAIKKPLRYDAIQTRTKCACCVLFSWIMAISLCCPPLLGNSDGHFYEEGFLCLLDASAVLPYSGTFGALVLLPTILTVCYTYGYIFSIPTAALIKDDEVQAHSDYRTSFLVIFVFFISWLPWMITKLLGLLSNNIFSNLKMKFWLLWIDELHATWTPLILILCSTRCKIGIKFCVTGYPKWDNENAV